MSDPGNLFNEQLISFLSILANEGATNAARGFGSMVGYELGVTKPNVRMVHLSEIPNLMGGPEKEAVGIYLRIEGDLTGQIMLVIPYEKAFELVKLLLGDDIPLSSELGRLERSALAEVGNLTASFFLNAVATKTGLSVRPSPPAVIVDMVGAILDIVIATTGGITEHVILLGSTFQYQEREVDCEFWVIPDPSALDRFTSGSN